MSLDQSIREIGTIFETYLKKLLTEIPRFQGVDAGISTSGFQRLCFKVKKGLAVSINTDIAVSTDPWCKHLAEEIWQCIGDGHLQHQNGSKPIDAHLLVSRAVLELHADSRARNLASIKEQEQVYGLQQLKEAREAAALPKQKKKRVSAFMMQAQQLPLCEEANDWIPSNSSLLPSSLALLASQAASLQATSVVGEDKKHTKSSSSFLESLPTSSARSSVKSDDSQTMAVFSQHSQHSQYSNGHDSLDALMDAESPPPNPTVKKTLFRSDSVRKRPFDCDNDENNDNQNFKSDLNSLDLDDYNAMPPLAKVKKTSPSLKDDAKSQLIKSQNVSRVNTSTPQAGTPRKKLEPKPVLQQVDMRAFLLGRVYVNAEASLDTASLHQPTPRPPASDQALSLAWIKVERRRNMKTLIDSLSDIAVKSVSLQLELENSVLDFVMCECNLLEEPLKKGMVLEVTNWTDIFDAVRKQSVSALAQKHDEEISKLREAAELDISSTIDGVNEDLTKDSDEENEHTSQNDDDDARIESCKAKINAALQSKMELKCAVFNNIKKKLNTAIHNMAVKVVVLWACANDCIPDLPLTLTLKYKHLRNSKDFKVNGGETYARNLLKAVKNTPVDPKQMLSLATTLAAKSTTTVALKKSPGSSKKSASSQSPTEIWNTKTPQPADQMDITNFLEMSGSGSSGIVGGSGLTLNSVDRLNSSSPHVGHLEVDGFVGKQALQQQPLARSHVHLCAAVKSYDALVKLLLRGEGYCRSDNNAMYLGFDIVPDNREAVVVRMKLLKSLLSAVFEVHNGLKNTTEAAQDLFCNGFQLMSCILAVSGRWDDWLRIRGDGYCFYRCLYHLYLKHKSSGAFDMAEAVARDKNCNTTLPNADSVGFQEFLVELGGNLRRSGMLTDADVDSMQDTIDLVATYSKAFPGEPISSEDWGTSDMVLAVTFPVATFSIVSDTGGDLSTRLNTQDCFVGTRWSVLNHASIVNTTKRLKLTVQDAVQVVQQCGFLSYAESHFTLIDVPSDGARLIESMTVKIAENLIGSLLLLTEDLVSQHLKQVGFVVDCLETNKPECEVPSEFNLTEFTGKLQVMKPHAVPKPHARGPVTVIDMSADCDEQDSPPSNKSPETVLIEQLQAKVFLFL